jgi:hypothetical protein
MENRFRVSPPNSRLSRLLSATEDDDGIRLTPGRRHRIGFQAVQQ